MEQTDLNNVYQFSVCKMADDILQKTRDSIASEGGSELTTLEDQPAALEMWAQIQAVQAEKYKAIQDAVAVTSKPFDEKLAELEAEYALLLRIST